MQFLWRPLIGEHRSRDRLVRWSVLANDRDRYDRWHVIYIFLSFSFSLYRFYYLRTLRDSVSLKFRIFYRPVLAGAVLQKPSSIISSASHSSFSSKSCCLYNQVAEVEQVSPLSLKRCVPAWELGIWNFEKMFTSHHISCVTCHASRFMCHTFSKVLELVGGGSVINRAYPIFFTFELHNFGFWLLLLNSS